MRDHEVQACMRAQKRAQNLPHPRTESPRFGSLTKTLRLVAALGTLLMAAGCSTEMSKTESAALKYVRDLGGMAVLGPKGTHVATLTVAMPDNNERVDQLVSQIAHFKNLTHLQVSNVNLTDEHMRVIGALKRINSLVVSGTPIGNEGVKHVAKLRLKSFYLANTKIAPEAMDAIGTIDSLEILDVSGSDVLSNPGPLRGLKHLEWLVANRASIPSAAIEVLSELPELKRLSLEESTITEADLRRLRSAKPQLQIDLVESPADGPEAESESSAPNAE